LLKTVTTPAKSAGFANVGVVTVKSGRVPANILNFPYALSVGT